MSQRGILADYVTVECPCGTVLMVPARMATEARCFSCEAARTEAQAKADAAKVKRGTDNKGGGGR